MAYTTECKCGRRMEALSQGQLDNMLKEHLEGKEHKRLLQAVKENEV